VGDAREAASIGFHVRHAIGSLDRLFTYARGETLSETQLATLAGEKTLAPRSSTPTQLANDFSAAIKKAHAQLRATTEASLLETRLVGRAEYRRTCSACCFTPRSIPSVTWDRS